MESEAKIREFEASFDRLYREYPEDPKVVYLASCYRSARGEHGVECNVHEASVLARRLWKLGLAVICPVKNTSMFGGIDVPDDCWLLGDFAMIRRCDAIVMHPNWETSSGAKQELEVARKHGLPVFYLMEHWRKLAAWAKKGASREVHT